MAINLISFVKNIPPLIVVMVGGLVWLILISASHHYLEREIEDRRVVKMGYMPVVTNLAAPILDNASKEGDGTRFKALKFASFAEMAEALRHGEIDVAFMIAPLSVVLHQQGEDVKIVYIGNRHESTMVARKDLNAKKLDDLKGKTIAVPMRYSGHNLSILDLIRNKGLDGQIKVVEMNPPDMASALASGSLDAYYVGEPFAAQTLMSGDSERIFYVEEVWENFICNLAIVRQDLIDQEPEVVSLMVNSAARSGIWASKNPELAVEVASQYWKQPKDLVRYALSTPDKRIIYEQFMPKENEMQYIADQMVKFELLENNDISGLVEDRFARNVNLEGITSLQSILEP